MKQDDAPLLHPRSDPLTDGGGIVVLPIEAVHVPLNGLHPHRADGGDHMVIVLPVRTADQSRRHPRNGGDLLITGRYIGDDLLSAEAVIVGMVIGVIHDLHPRIVKLRHRLGIPFHPIPHHEKGGLYIIPPQNIDKLLRILVAPR